jgi:hypothetical protein
MKHLKNFSLFESKNHKLPLPKDQAELDVLSESPGFQKLRNLKGRNGGCQLVITRNGGVEIISPVRYNFRVSPAGSFYYGGLKVGPKHGTELDTWDKLFDYAYLYFLGTGLNVATTDALENFVFHGVISPTLYSRIKENEYYPSILDMSRKYVGGSADESVADAAAKLSTYITDPAKILETSSYKFFDKIFEFNPEIEKNSIKIDFGTKTPLGIFRDLNLTLPGYFGTRIFIELPGPGRASTGPVKVKTMKGLDQSFLKEITHQYQRAVDDIKSTLYIRRAGDVSVALSNILLEIFSICIDNYKEGKDAPDIRKESEYSIIGDVFYNWKMSNDGYIKSLISVIDTGQFDYIAKEVANSKKTIEILQSIELEDPIKYSEIMRDIMDVPFLGDATKDLYNKTDDLIKGGSLLRRFVV